MKFSLPRVIGMKGACGYAPENTLDSIKTAAELGCRWVGLDVKLTKDSVPVIFHDDTLERTTNGSGNIADMLYADIQDLDAGSWYSDGFAGVAIPTLEEAIEVLYQHNLGLNLEINPSPGRENETAEVALDVLTRIWDDMDTIMLSSSQHVTLETCLDMAPDFKRALSMEDPLPNWNELADYLQVSAINIDGRDKALTRESVENYIESGKLIGAYTINDPLRAKLLFSWGVDFVFSDTPDVIKQTDPTKH